MSKRKWRDRAQAAADAVASALGASAPEIESLRPGSDPEPEEPSPAARVEMAERLAGAGILTPEEASARARTAVDLPPGAKFMATTSEPRGFVRAGFGIAPGDCDRRLVFVDSIEWRCACGARGLSVRPGDGVPYHDVASMAHLPGESRG